MCVNNLLLWGFEDRFFVVVASLDVDVPFRIWTEEERALQLW